MTAKQLIDEHRPTFTKWQEESQSNRTIFVVAEQIDGDDVDGTFAIQGSEVGIANLMYHLLHRNPVLARPIAYALAKLAEEQANTPK